MKFAKKILALVCALVIALILCSCGTSESLLEWPTTGLATYLPTPEAEYGKVTSNLDNGFIARINEITEDDYQNYLAACKEKGFVNDAEEDNSSYTAFNDGGYKLSLDYYSSLEYYEIDLDAPKFEAGSTFTWPSNGLALLIPEPASNVGEISYESSRYFTVYVGETSIDDYNDYIDKCIELGFDVDYRRSEKNFRAYNAEGYRLNISYEGFNTIYINVVAPDEPEEASEAPDNTENEDNESAENTMEMTTPPEEISPEIFEDSSEAPDPTQVETSEQTSENSSSTETSTPDILTADNCPEFAEVLSCGDYSNQLYADFYEKYKGKKIEFDGNIVLVENDDYNGYYDVMICPGDYQENVAYGPLFEFDGASPSAFEEGNNSMELPSYVKVGTNVHVVATLSRYNDFAGVCYLYPTSVTER